jgi:uncharacterized protein YwgA
MCQFQLTIPIKPFLKKMIAKNNAVEPFLIKQRCHYGQLIFGNLKRNYIDIKVPANQNYPEQLSILISTELSKQNRVMIDTRTVAAINQALSSMFYDKLFTFLECSSHGKGDIKRNVEQFLDTYEITEDDLKRDTLIKKYYRWRQKHPEKDTRNFRRNANNQDA